MIISAFAASLLLRSGKATKTTVIIRDDGRRYQAIDRHDLARVDHYRID